MSDRMADLVTLLCLAMGRKNTSYSDQEGGDMTVCAHPAPRAGTDREAVRRAPASSPELRHLVEAAAPTLRQPLAKNVPQRTHSSHLRSAGTSSCHGAIE